MTVFLRKAVAVEGLLYTGPSMLTQVQDFLRPMSPAYNPQINKVGQGQQLLIFVRDFESEARYVNIGVQHKLVVVPVGHWIIKDGDGNLEVRSAEEISRDFDPDVQVPALPGGTGELGSPVFAPGQDLRATHPRVTMAAHADKPQDVSER